MASQDWMQKDFYATLGVDKSASQDDIKKAYRKLARKYHPDQNPGDKAAENKFKEVSEAFQVLSNEQDRKQYDAIRTMSGGGARFSPGAGGAGGFEDVFSSMFGGGNVRFNTGGGAPNPGFEDILSSMFGAGAPKADSQGGFGGFGGFGSRRRERGDDVITNASIPLRDAIGGTTVSVTTPSGKVTARIPAGVTDGQKIRIKGKGQPGINGGESGDILIKVAVEPHPVYELRGKDVYINVPVAFDEAALGATVDVPTLYGETVHVKVPEGSSSDKTLRVRGRGVQPTKGEAGDMYVRLKVVVPKKMSEETRAAVEAFRKASEGADPRAEFQKMAQV
ncbi:DnaJ C-terminal domain-containing protein [Arcanobacterium bovis]|uniref:J domain-containing protein n=1 Tax=Arcanobacterium bovis TaxID=2529275 RepID=A0A4Q9UZF6_9ACTO|nr:DnaJ C-terminal domain-containing protein [Arcanobacterium bovis]TBW21403.1 J domain-containing protein [Arcanobacterium bovis]